MNIVVLIGAIGITAIGGYFAFRERIFTGRRKRKSIVTQGHPYDVNNLPTGAYLHYQEGLMLALKRQYEAALDEYELALDIVPDHKGILFQVTLTLVNMKRFEEAESIVTVLLEKNPMDYFAKYLNGVIHHHKGNLAAALKAYDSALYRQMGFPQPYLNRARLYITRKDYQKAQADIDRAKQLTPENSQVWCLQGHVLQQQGNLEAAKNSYEKAVGFNPNDAEALTFYAQVLGGLGQLDEASEQVGHVLEISPNYEQAQLVAARIYLAQQRWNDALALYLNALKHTYDIQALSSINTNLSNVYIELKDYENAVSRAQKAIEQNSKQFWAYNNRGWAYFNLGKYDLALADYNRAIELNPNETKPYVNRAWLYSTMENHQKALEDFDAAIKLNPNISEGYNNRGIAYFNLGKYDLALADYNHAIELDPNDSKPYSNRGRMYTKLGDRQKALEDHDAAIKLNPKRSISYNNRAWAKASFGDYEGSLKDAEKAIELSPNAANHFDTRGHAK